MTAQAPLAGEPVPGSRFLLDFLHLPGELGAEQRGAWLVLGRNSSSHLQDCLHGTLSFAALGFWRPRTCWDLQPLDSSAVTESGELAGPGALDVAQ